MSLTGAYDKDGERVVGGTLRSDGSVRPIAKVRPGYIAKEDVPKYKPRAARERDAKLGIASSASPVTKVDTNAGHDAADDNKSAIKARIQAMKAEFERKKAEKAQKETKGKEEIAETQTGDEGEESEEESLEIPQDREIGNLIAHIGDLTVSRVVENEEEVVPKKLESRHKRVEKEVEITERKETDITESKPSPGQSKPATITPKAPLRSRHAKPKESDKETEEPPKETSKEPAEKPSGYVPPHKRK